MSRKERLEQMGDRAKNFTNVYLKNFGEEIDDEKLREMMKVYGKIISARVFVQLNCANFFWQCLITETWFSAYVCQILGHDNGGWKRPRFWIRQLWRSWSCCKGWFFNDNENVRFSCFRLSMNFDRIHGHVVICTVSVPYYFHLNFVPHCLA